MSIILETISAKKEVIAKFGELQVFNWRMQGEVASLLKNNCDLASLTLLLEEFEYFSQIIDIRRIKTIQMEKDSYSKQDYVSKIREIYLLIYEFYTILFSDQCSALIMSLTNEEECVVWISMKSEEILSAWGIKVIYREAESRDVITMTPEFRSFFESINPLQRMIH